MYFILFSVSLKNKQANIFRFLTLAKGTALANAAAQQH